MNVLNIADFHLGFNTVVSTLAQKGYWLMAGSQDATTFFMIFCGWHLAQQEYLLVAWAHDAK